MKELIEKNFQEHLEVIQRLSLDFPEKIEEISKVIIDAYKKNKKLLIVGNGGSSADAQHIAGELVNKFYYDRKPLRAMSLSLDSCAITSWANDKGYDSVFERQVEAHGDLGDILIAISTSGNSSNIIRAVNKAREKSLITVGLLGNYGGKLKGVCHYELIVPSSITPRIQEAHELIYHTLCQLVEEEFALEK
jgi:D-sedoheptulose 7-phosphate isomerase